MCQCDNFINKLRNYNTDKDKNGSIDLNELQLCFEELQVDLSQEEVEDFYKECDMDSTNAIEFKEFILVLAWIYLLGTPISQSSINETNVSILQ